MKIVKDLKSDRLERKLSNGLTEIKIFWNNGQLWKHYFLDENDNFHDEYKRYSISGNLIMHKLFEHGYCMKDLIWK